METIKLKSNIGIKNIREFHNNIKSILEKEQELLFDFSLVKKIDLSVAQVLLSVRKTVRGDGKNDNLRLKNVSDDIKKQLEIVGF